VLIDVTPLSLGIETQGGVFTRLIERNTAIPTSHSQLFTTAIDEQGAVDIHVLQGERDFAKDNKTLGKFQLVGIPPSPRGVPRIEVTFDIDVNGIVHVSARDLATDNVQKVTITASSGLSRTEVSQMVEEAERYRQADAKRREDQEIRNKAEQTVYIAKKTIEDSKDVVDGSLVTNVQDAAALVQNALNNFDVANIKTSLELLDKAIFSCSAALYQQKGASYAEAQAAAASAIAEPIVEAVAPQSSTATATYEEPSPAIDLGLSSDADFSDV
jgi:molecular chaperone DnaK